MTGARHSSLLEPMGNKSIVDRIISRITNSILSGEIKPGEKIYTEIELAESMGVGRNSVREAIKSLVSMGVLEIRRSEGTFVATGFSERMLEPMVYGLVLEGGETRSVLELRYIMETGILQMAIDSAKPYDIADLERELEKIRLSTGGADAARGMLAADLSFHRRLTAITKNPLIDKFATVLERVTMGTRSGAIEKFLENGEAKKFVELHETLLNIIRDRDYASVNAATSEHYGYWAEELGK